MRTTIQIDDRLLAEARQAAAQSGRTLAELIEEALRESLARNAEQQRARPVRLVTDGSGGLQPGVSLDRTADLLDVMDEPHVTD